jgi:hypothetical protein
MFDKQTIKDTKKPPGIPAKWLKTTNKLNLATTLKFLNPQLQHICRM